MPTAFSQLDQSFPAMEGRDTDAKLRAVQDYLYQLLEQLRYILNNISPDNFNEQEVNGWAGETIVKPIQAQITDTERGLVTLINVTAGRVILQVTSDLAPEWATGIAYKKDDIVKVTTTENDVITAVDYYKCTADHTSAAGNKPPSSKWESTPASGVSKSLILQTASSITSTVASAQSKYDTTGINVSTYGYGPPEVQAASGVIYLDQSTGYYYTSNGTTWTKSANPLPLITTNLQSQITQLPGEIMLDVRGDYADEWVVWADQAQTVRKHYYVNDVVKVSSSSAVAFYKCNTEHNSYSTTKPPSANWDAVAAPSVQSMIDMNLGGITLAYDNTGVSGDNSSYIKLHKDGIDIGGGTIQMTNVKADSLTADAVQAIELDASQITAGTLNSNVVYAGNISADQITAGTLDAGNITMNGSFSVTTTHDDTDYACGHIGGEYDSGYGAIFISSPNGDNFALVDDTQAMLRSRLGGANARVIVGEDSVWMQVRKTVNGVVKSSTFSIDEEGIYIQKYGGTKYDLFDLV